MKKIFIFMIFISFIIAPIGQGQIMSKRYIIENNRAFYTQGLPENPDKFELKADLKTFKEFDRSHIDRQYSQVVAADSLGFFLYKEFYPWPDAHLAEFITSKMIKSKGKLYLVYASNNKIEPFDSDANVQKLEGVRGPDLSSEVMYFKDGVSIYYWPHFSKPFIKMKTSDLSKFEVISNSFARDDKYVFLGDKIVIDADPVSFKKEMRYGKDKHNVFYLQMGQPSRVEDADVATFHEVDAEDNSFDGEDKNGSFKSGKRLRP